MYMLSAITLLSGYMPPLVAFGVVVVVPILIATGLFLYDTTVLLPKQVLK